ncbi:MAG: hypothetical protein OYI31_03885 [Chloroflexota bacterium]|nr:hypothetical protein [Chloroflexota bacterium]MDE2940823.1 hypothetical protein [Chloroflexota bacterium]MDE3267587.1 hypothetical protein [Chloroflexota bacterium]
MPGAVRAALEAVNGVGTGEPVIHSISPHWPEDAVNGAITTADRM